MTVQINIKDLPLHGLRLIGPLDPSFEGKVSALLKGKKNPFVEALKPFSVFLKNTGNKAVVGYWLKWEMVKSDGTIVSRETGGVNPTPLMDGGAPGSEHLSLTGGYAVKSNSTKFVSLAFSLSEEEGGTIGAYAGGSVDHSVLDRLQQATKDEGLISMQDRIVAELQSYKSITVSLDGAFFEDGTFVGPDSTGFFAGVQANLDAKRDLLEEIAFGIKRNRSLEDIFGDIEELANSQNTFIPPEAITADYYNYYKNMYAKEILSMRNAMDSQRAIAMSLQPLRKQWPKLKKQ